MKLYQLVGPAETPAYDVLSEYIELTTFIEFQWFGTKLQDFRGYEVKHSTYKNLPNELIDKYGLEGMKAFNDIIKQPK